MAENENSNKSNRNIVDALVQARSINQYVLSVEMIIDKSLKPEEAKAFLLYLAESVFDPGDERDIVLASWRLLQGFESVETLKECHKLFSELSAYKGALGGLNHKETDTLYPKIAKYYTRIQDKDTFLAEAIRTKLPNKKGKVQLPELYNKKVVAPIPSPSPPDLVSESKSKSADNKWFRPMIAGIAVVFLVTIFLVSKNWKANTTSDEPTSEDEIYTFSFSGGNSEGEQRGDSGKETDASSDASESENITYNLTYADGDGAGEYWGDSSGGRQTYTKKEINSGALGDTIVFNSITDGEYGDERNFVGAALVSGEETVWYGDSIEVEDGKTYVICLYVRNDNPHGLNAIAENARVSFDLPNATNKSLTITGYIKSSNAEPDCYWDSVTLYSNENFSINYIEDSAQYTNSRMQGTPLPTDIIMDGVPLGDGNFDGMLPGGYGYEGIVTIKVAVHSSPITELSIGTRLKGTSQWSDHLYANIGDEVEFQIEYRNLLSDTVEDVMIRDILPDNVEYIEGSTYLYTSEIQDGALLKSDAVTTDGINIGSNYQPRADAYVYFSARVVDNDLIRGTTQLVNWANATVNGEVTKDNVSIMVTK